MSKSYRLLCSGRCIWKGAEGCKSGAARIAINEMEGGAVQSRLRTQVVFIHFIIHHQNVQPLRAGHPVGPACPPSFPVRHHGTAPSTTIHHTTTAVSSYFSSGALWSCRCRSSSLGPYLILTHPAALPPGGALLANQLAVGVDPVSFRTFVDSSLTSHQDPAALRSRDAKQQNCPLHHHPSTHHLAAVHNTLGLEGVHTTMICLVACSSAQRKARCLKPPLSVFAFGARSNTNTTSTGPVYRSIDIASSSTVAVHNRLRSIPRGLCSCQEHPTYPGTDLSRRKFYRIFVAPSLSSCLAASSAGKATRHSMMTTNTTRRVSNVNLPPGYFGFRRPPVCPTPRQATGRGNMLLSTTLEESNCPRKK